MFWVIAGVLLSACGSEDADTDTSASTLVESGSVEPEPVTPVLVEADTLTEVLLPCDLIQPVRAHQFLCVEDGALSWVDEVAGTTLLLDGITQVAGTASGDDVFLVADGTPYLLDGDELLAVDWDVPVPIEMIQSHDEQLWMLGSGRLFELADGGVTEISVEGVPHIYGFALTEAELFISAPQWMAVSLADREAGVTAMGERPAEAIAADAFGGLWWLSEGRVFHRRADGLSQEVALPEPIHEIVGPDVWLVGDEHTYRVQGAAMEVHDVVAAGVVGVDTYGRLMRRHEGQVYRHSAGRPVVVTGLSGSLMVSETLTLLPSDPDSVETLSAWVNDQPLAVSGVPYQVTLNPESLVDGAHDLRFFTTSTKGDHMSIHPLWVGSLPEVEWPEIQALSQAHCDRCHGGDTLTDLTTALGWEQRIDDIISLVSTDQMPLGGPYLSDEEIVLIRAWKHGGFQ